MTLASIEIQSHDTKLFRFSLPSEQHILGLPVGKHIRITCPNRIGCKPGEWNGNPEKELHANIHRNYTPVSVSDASGYFELLVKIYRSNVDPFFPDGGKSSQYLDSLKVGDAISVSGPFGLVQYVGKGVLENKRKPLYVKHLGLVAGGSGITPMLQIIASILNDPNDTTKITLLYCNSTPKDILMKNTLDEYQAKHPDQFTVWYTVSREVGVDWKYSVGRVNQIMIEKHLPKPGEGVYILLCGPRGMVRTTCVPALHAIGFAASSVITL